MNKFNYQWKLTDLESVKKNNIKVFSCFAGAGGSSMGYKMAGCDVIGCNEIDERQIKLYKKNLNPKYSYCEDIRDFTNRDDLPDELFNLDILDASPPCSLFSTSNIKADKFKGKKKKFREGQKEQVLDDLFFEAIKLVDKLKPKLVIFENVKGLISKKNIKYVHRIFNELHNVGYFVSCELLKSEDFGVPQSRHRVFIFAIRNDIKCKSTDLSGSPVFKFKKDKHILWGEVVEQSNERQLTDYMMKFWNERIDSDIGFQQISFRMTGRENHLFNSMFQKNDKVASTITTRGGAVLYDQPRKPLDIELIKCSSFPLDYDFMGSSPLYSLGMSVPPLMISKIVTTLLENISLK